MGLASASPHHRVCYRSFSLLPPDHTGLFALTGDGYAFQNDAEPDHISTWYSMRTDVPFMHDVPTSTKAVTHDDTCSTKLRITEQSPLFAVEHKLYISLTCTYDLTEGENPQRATERLQFYIPLHFGRPAPAPSSPFVRSPLCALVRSRQGHSPSSSVDSVDSTTPLVSGNTSIAMMPVPSLPYAQTLPAYSQLFDMYGNVKVDLSDPLPLYTPKPSAETPPIDSTPHLADP